MNEGGRGDAHLLASIPGWGYLQSHLALAVPAAIAGGDELTVAVLELEGARPGIPLRLVRSDTTRDTDLLRLLDSVRLRFGGMAVYRLGARSFAVVGAGVNALSMGQCVLLATATGPCRFRWGTASVRRAGSAAAASPEVLVVLALADLHRRHRDHARVHRATARRPLATVGSVAAASMLLAGAAVALGSSPGPVPTIHQAQRAGAPSGPSAPAEPPAPIPPFSTVPVPTPNAAPPPAAPRPAPAAGSTGPAATDEVLAADLTPSVHSSMPQSPASPSPAPPSPPAVSPSPAAPSPRPWSPAYGKWAADTRGHLAFAFGHPDNSGAVARQDWCRGGFDPASLYRSLMGTYWRSSLPT